MEGQEAAFQTLWSDPEMTKEKERKNQQPRRLTVGPFLSMLGEELT